MSPCVEYLPNIHICFNDNDLLRIGTVKPKWCARCRMWLLHRLEVRGSRRPSYYEPHVVWACRRCSDWSEQPVSLLLLTG